MNVSRRKFLMTSASVAVITAFSGVFKAIANTKPLDNQVYRQLCQRWGDIITGRNLIKNGDTRYASAIQGLDKNVARVLDDLIREPNRTSVFRSSDLTANKSPDITKTARAALTLATGWATPGSQYYQQENVLQDAINALNDFLKLRYHPGQEEYGNWWDWESGASRAVADMMCLLYDKLPNEVMQAAAAGVNYFVPDPWYLRTQAAAGADNKQGQKTLATGANRLDLSRSVICAALATHDPERIYHALAGLPATWEFVTSGDGFYKDGSFIQHQTIPYTGSYGDVLISTIALIFSLVSDSAFNVPKEQLEAVYWTVDEAFIPVMIEGQVLDCVRGRSVSRITEPASQHGSSIMKAILQLAQGAPKELSDRWKGICKGWIERNHYDPLSTKGSIPYLALVFDALETGTSIEANKTPKMFTSMDRLVHRTENWTMAIAMCSKRIAWYECGNKENEWASRTGSGMRYLYLPQDLGQFEDGFWPTLDYAAPVGTTVDTQLLLQQAAGEWGHETPDNLWTGGLTYNGFSFAGMDFIGPDKNGLHARRVWFGTPHSMLEMVTDVQTQAEQAMTVVENRNLGENGKNTLTIDGHDINDKESIFNQPKWAYLENVGGYIFLQSGKLKSQITTRKGSWEMINPARKAPGTDIELTRRWASMQFLHDKDGSPAAWLILPQATKEETIKQSERIHKENLYKIIQNNAQAQILQYQNLTAWAIWQAGEYQGITFNQPTLTLFEQNGDQNNAKLLVVEPTQTANQLSLEIKGNWKLVEQNSRVNAQIKENKLHLVFNTEGLAGKAIELTLKKA